MLGQALVTTFGFMSGKVPLAECYAASLHFREQLVHHEQNVVLSLFQPLLQVVANLYGQSEDPFLLSGYFMDETTRKTRHQYDRNLLGESVFHIAKGTAAFFLNDFKLAETCAKKSKSLKKAMNMSAPITHLQLFYEGMGHLIAEKPNV